jgi:hypothetical protein
MACSCSGGWLGDARGAGGTCLEFGEGCRGEITEVLVGGGGQADEDPEEIVARIESASQALAEQGGKRRCFGAGLWGTDEEPVLSVDGGGTDGILDPVMPTT